MIRLGKKITIPSKMYMREFAISIFINELRYWYRHPVLDDTELYLEHIRYNKEIVEIKIKEKKRFIGNRHLLPPSNISKKKGNFPPMKSFDAVFIIFIPCVVIWKSNFVFELWSLQHVYTTTYKHLYFSEYSKTCWPYDSSILDGIQFKYCEQILVVMR